MSTQAPAPFLDGLFQLTVSNAGQGVGTSRAMNFVSGFTVSKNSTTGAIDVGFSGAFTLPTGSVIKAPRLTIAGATTVSGGPGGDGELYVYANSRIRFAIGSTVTMTLQEGRVAWGPGSAVSIPIDFTADLFDPQAQINEIVAALVSLGLAQDDRSP